MGEIGTNGAVQTLALLVTLGRDWRNHRSLRCIHRLDLSCKRGNARVIRAVPTVTYVQPQLYPRCMLRGIQSVRLRFFHKPVPPTTSSNSSAEVERLPGWRFLLALSIAIALISGQLGTWGLGIAGSGGPERYVRGKTDLIAVLTGALMIRAGDGPLLYDLAVQHEYQKQILAPYRTLNADSTLPNSHPPFESLLVALLMDLPYPVIFGLWTLLELAALAASLWILATVLPGDRTVRWTMIALACAYYPVHAMLWLGQSSSLLLLGLCGAYAALKHRRDTWAGLALALLAIKPQLALPVVLLLLVQRRWQPLAVMIGILTAASLAAIPFLGALWPLRYVSFLASVRDWGGNLSEHPALMYNWRGLALNTMGLWSPPLVTPLVSGLVAASACIVLWLGWRMRRYSVPSEAAGNLVPRVDLVWALLGLAAVLLPVHLYLHDYSLLILPGWILGVYATSSMWNVLCSRLWLLLLWSSFALALLGFFLLDRPAMAIVPNVGLIATAFVLLTGQLVALLCSRDQPVSSAALAGELEA